MVSNILGDFIPYSPIYSFFYYYYFDKRNSGHNSGALLPNGTAIVQLVVTLIESG